MTSADDPGLVDVMGARPTIIASCTSRKGPVTLQNRELLGQATVGPGNEAQPDHRVAMVAVTRRGAAGTREYSSPEG